MSEKIQSTKTCSCGRTYHNYQQLLMGTSRWRICDQGNLYFNCSCGSTLVLRKGAYDWYSLPDHLTAASASLFNQLQAKAQLPYIPHLVFEIQRELAHSAVTASRLARLAHREPLLHNDILRIANSIRDAGADEIKSLEHAIAYVGNQVLSEIVQMAALKSFTLTTYNYTPKVYWDEAVLTGLLAEYLAKNYAPHISSQAAFIAGTHLNIGKFVGAFYLPDLTDIIYKNLANSQSLRHTWQQEEVSLGVPSHGLLGEIGAVFWGLPDYVRECSVNHHSLPALAPDRAHDSISLFEVAALANQLAHLAVSENYRCDQEILNGIITRCGLPAPTELLKDLPRIKTRMAKVFY